MGYHDERKAKTNIAHALKNQGWKIYGYRADESDSMTDYYSPAYWNGIATKNGFTLVVDAWSKSESGKEIIENTKNVDFSKISKLEALRDNHAASEGEKANAQNMIDKINASAEAGKVVVDIYPTYMTSKEVGKTTKWHIEKDGGVVAKGNGIYKFGSLTWDYNCHEMKYESRNRWTGEHDENGNQVRKASEPSLDEQKLIDSFEKFINKMNKIVSTKTVVGDGTEKTEKEGLQAQEDDKLVKVIKTKKTTVKKVVELLEVKDMKDAKYFKLVSSFNYGCRSGFIYKLDNELGFDRAFKMNGKLTKMLTGSATRSNRFTGDIERLNQWISKGAIVACDIIDEEIIEEYEAWETAKPQKSTKKESVKTSLKTESDNNDLEMTVNFNDEKNGIELSFTGKPSEEVRKQLKDNGFRWHRVNKIWYTKDTEEKRGFVESLQSSEIIQDEVKKKETKVKVDDNTKELAQIEKQIASLDKKINALSGDYLTNTPKRMREQAERVRKIEVLEDDKNVLIYIKEKLISGDYNPKIKLFIVSSFRELTQRYMYSDNRGTLEYPTVSPSNAEWFNDDQKKRIKKLQQKGINNKSELIELVYIYKMILEYIDNPEAKAQAQRKLKRQQLEQSSQKGDVHFTPDSLVDKMIDYANLNDGDTVLEPSAGLGNIADKIAYITSKENITCCEYSYEFCEYLKDSGYSVNNGDFLEYETNIKFNKVLMNPPFSKNQDIKHVLHAYELLEEGGRLVAIMSPHWTFANDKESQDFRAFIDNNCAEWYNNDDQFSHTKIKTVIVVIDK